MTAETFEAIIPFEKVGACPSYGSVIPLKDDRLLWVWGTGSAKEPLQSIYGNISSDEGRTWTDSFPLKLQTGGEMKGIFTTNLVRLASGALGLIQRRAGQRAELLSFHLSEDDGQTWSEEVYIHPPEASVYCTHDCALTLSSGRLIMPVYSNIGATPTSNKPKSSLRFGEEFSNGMASTMSFAFVYYSDDEGATWQRSRNETFAVLEKGIKGCYATGEPSVVELKDGRLLMLLRTNLGRHFRSYSEDRGETWQEAEPTDLVCYPAPCSLRRIPGTGDLLIVWSQVSPWETMIGLYRHRLSCAISKDEGQTWQNHKNLESLDDVSYIEPCPIEHILIGTFRQPVDRVRYCHAPAPLRYNQPTCTFINNQAVITYCSAVLGKGEEARNVIVKTYGMDYEALVKKLGFTPNPRNPNSPIGNNKIRVLPIDWFYS